MFRTLIIILLFLLPLSLYPENIDSVEQKQRLLNSLKTVKPGKLSLYPEGIIKRFKPAGKQLALTFDACGGKNGSAYDRELIKYLSDHNIKATLFLSSKWIEANPEPFKALAANPMFEIENHGLKHKPCSAEGKKAYGIKGTANLSEMYDEIVLSAQKLTALTGKPVKFYRSGTAHYDNVCVEMLKSPGYKGVNFNVLPGDADKLVSAKKMASIILKAKPGSIVLLHMNRPGGDTLKALKTALPELIKQGYTFIHLQEADF